MSNSTKLKRHTPISDDILIADTLKIQTIPDPAKVIVQRSASVTDRKMATFGKNFKKAFGVDLPLQVCSKAVSDDGSVTVVCTTPYTWIVLSDTQNAKTIADWVQKTAAQKIVITASEMTDQYICLDIKGPKARALLAKGCAVDLSPEVFAEHHSIRTLLAQANVVIWHTDPNDFRILFDISLSDYLGHWLKGAAAEFSLPVL